MLDHVPGAKKETFSWDVLPSDFFLHPSTPTVPFIWQGSRNMITSSWSPFGITKYDHMILLILPSLNSRNIITWSCSLFGIRKHDHIILLLLTSLNSEIWSLDLFSFLDLEIWSHDPAPSSFMKFRNYDRLILFCFGDLEIWSMVLLLLPSLNSRNMITWSCSLFRSRNMITVSWNIHHILETRLHDYCIFQTSNCLILIPLMVFINRATCSWSFP
jgi:hypothetical protein